jgi:hypothetical protein
MTRIDTSRQDMSWACRLANRGYDQTGIRNALAAKPSGRRAPGSIKYQRLLETRGLEAADAYAIRTAANAVSWIAANPAIKDRPAGLVSIIEIESLAGALPWLLYGGAGARHALEGVFVVAERIGSLSFGLALREWSELVGEHERLIRGHRDTLIDLWWLRRNRADRNGRTARFSLRPGRHIHSHGRSECAPAADRGWLAHDAFRPEALGDVGWYVLSVLTQPRTVDDVSVRTGLDVEDVWVLIRRLHVAELVDITDNDVVVRAGNLIPQLNIVADAAGTLGTLAADRERHDQDRVAFRDRRDVNVPEVVS